MSEGIEEKRWSEKNPLEHARNHANELDKLIEDLAKLHENGHGVVTNSYLNAFIQHASGKLHLLQDYLKEIESK